MKQPSLLERIDFVNDGGWIAVVFGGWRPAVSVGPFAVQAPAFQGSITVRPAAVNALASREATTKSCDAAVAAI